MTPEEKRARNAARMRESYHASPENRARREESNRRWRAANPDRVRALRRRAKKRYEAANPEKKRAYQREYYRRNFERDKPRRNATSRQWRAANKERANSQARASKFRNRYGITLEDKDALLASQGGKCANETCDRTDPGPRGWHLDHRHSDGFIRGVLCGHCNTALGFACDSPQILRGLADYAEKHAA